MGLSQLYAEWKARRAGRQGMEPSGIFRATRDVIGPIGWMWSNAWDAMDEGKDAYVGSFDRRLPPSEFISARDRTRHGIPIPLVERVVEDHRKDPADEAG